MYAAGWQLWQAPHFELFTDGGSSRPRQVIERIEQARHALLALTKERVAADGEIRVVLFRREAEFATFRPAGAEKAAGFYVQGRNRDSIGLLEGSPELGRAAVHEYVHLFLNRGGAQIPEWFNEGMAEMLSTLVVSGGRVRIGQAIPQHVGLLQDGGLPDLSSLLRSFRNTPEAYAGAWALVHMLVLSPEYQKGLTGLLGALAGGASHEKAFEAVYGKTVSAVQGDLRAYAGRRRFAEVVLEVPVFGGLERIEPRPATTVESGLALTDLLLSLGRVNEAAQRLDELKAEAGDSAALAVELADLALRQGRVEEALAQYSRAIDLGSRDARLYFERAMLEQDRERVLADLQKAIELQPDFGEARRRLGAELLRSGRLAEAAEHLEVAAGLLPDDPAIRQDLTLARQAPGVAKTSGKKGWANPKGDHTVTGKLTGVDCLGGSEARLWIETESGRMALHVSDPAKVVLTQAPGSNVELACGAVTPRDVLVEYRGESGEVTAIAWR